MLTRKYIPRLRKYVDLRTVVIPIFQVQSNQATQTWESGAGQVEDNTSPRFQPRFFAWVVLGGLVFKPQRAPYLYFWPVSQLISIQSIRDAGYNYPGVESIPSTVRRVRDSKLRKASPADGILEAS